MAKAQRMYALKALLVLLVWEQLNATSSPAGVLVTWPMLRLRLQSVADWGAKHANVSSSYSASTWLPQCSLVLLPHLPQCPGLAWLQPCMVAPDAG